MRQKHVFMFPGQGILGPEVLDILEKHSTFKDVYACGCEINQIDFLQEIKKGNYQKIRENKYYSALVTITNLAALSWVEDWEQPEAYCGYSIGQYSALYAAGCVDLESLFRIILKRSELMLDSIEKQETGMLGVIGVLEQKLLDFLEEFNYQLEHPVVIANYNCPGNYTIAGTKQNLLRIGEKIDVLSPKQVIPLDVSGAWHSYFLKEAGEGFTRFLEGVEFIKIPENVINNVSGNFFDKELSLIKTQLGQHIYSPVKWDLGISSLIENGFQRFLELGFGKTLATYNFFINREIRTLVINSPEVAEKLIISKF
ncbi:MAG: hypothetical protein COB67_00990 [SAR324 cluster bacterium]|uniref:[acyl-carrier-protein] S-malonyltransferase n=1 Tax=SAR324 cluster bacterium TaxID=2024889 RepID=A0A2A4TCR2_9DELT|nr:MAG: hypothetical protein COB67_00990 [SAR324 cluster bacterium]